MNQPKIKESVSFKDLIQFLAGDKKGLLCQVIEVVDGKVRCFARSFDGTPHFFEVPVTAPFAVVGQARLGPKPPSKPEPDIPRESAAPLKQGSSGEITSVSSTDSVPASSLPPPLRPEEFLTPLPPDTKIVPMKEALPLPDLPTAKPWKLEQESAVPPDKVPSVLPLPPAALVAQAAEKRSITMTVRNANGDATTVTFRAPRHLPFHRLKGPAIIKAIKIIPNVKPFSFGPVESEGEKMERI